MSLGKLGCVLVFEDDKVHIVLGKVWWVVVLEHDRGYTQLREVP